MLLFAVPILVTKRLTQIAGPTRPHTVASPQSSLVHVSARSNPANEWMIWFMLMVSAVWAALAAFDDGDLSRGLLVASLTLAAGGLVGLLAKRGRGPYVARARPTTAPPIRQAVRATRTHPSRPSP